MWSQFLLFPSVISVKNVLDYKDFPQEMKCIFLSFFPWWYFFTPIVRPFCQGCWRWKKRERERPLTPRHTRVLIRHPKGTNSNTENGKFSSAPFTRWSDYSFTIQRWWICSFNSYFYGVWGVGVLQRLALELWGVLWVLEEGGIYPWHVEGGATGKDDRWD